MDTSEFLGGAYLLTGWMSGLGGGNSRESHWLGYRTTMLGSGPVSWDTVVIVGKYTCAAPFLVSEKLKCAVFSHLTHNVFDIERAT